jgi:DNA-binding NtrC family response regulator
MAKILVVDDEELIRELAVETLQRMGMQCTGASDGPKGLELLGQLQPDLVISDYKMPGMTGLEFLREVQRKNPKQPFMMMTAYGTIDTAVDAMKQGAMDFIEKPFQPEILEMAVQRILDMVEIRKENEVLKKQLDARHSFVGQGKAFEGLNQLVQDVATSNATILITGESGVGKEVLARAMHYHSKRMAGPFIKINCAALPEALIESELFGYEKGAFTGAIKMKKGKFELADHGTLLLDEVGEMPLTAQSKLLRVLQEREVSRVGADEDIAVDVRIICTTNRNLEEEVQKGNFREDLYYRLSVIPVHIPPLRERRDDIPLLVEHFIQKFNGEYGYSVEGIEAEALDLVQKYPWPGNIRQLENAMERAMVFSKTGMLVASKFQLLSARPAKVDLSNQQGIRPGMTVGQMEQLLILKTLQENGGNKTKAAEMLDISIRTLRNKLHEYEEQGTYSEESAK